MALTPTPVCVQVPKATTLSISGSTYVANTLLTLVTGGPNGNKIVAVTAVNTDTGAHVVQLFNNGSLATLASFSVPANAGNDGATNNANVMKLWEGLPRDNDGQPYFFLEPSATLGITSTTTLPAGKFLNITVVHGQF